MTHGMCFVPLAQSAHRNNPNLGYRNRRRDIERGELSVMSHRRKPMLHNYHQYTPIPTYTNRREGGMPDLNWSSQLAPNGHIHNPLPRPELGVSYSRAPQS